jgi:hypothetical protein
MASTAPKFTQSGILGIIQVTTANTALDGTGTLATLVTGDANQSKINKIIFKATATVTDGMLRIFLHDGTNARLLKEIIVTATVPSATTKSFSYEETGLFDETPFILPSNYSLRIGTQNTETFNCIAIGGNY